MLVAIVVFMGLAGIAYAYTQNLGNWAVIPTSISLPFWTSSSNPQSCGWLNNASSCPTKTWNVTASGTRGIYQIMVNFTSDNTNVSWKNTSYINVTIYEKGDSGVILRENTSVNCPGCAFTIPASDYNPYSCGWLDNSSCGKSWNVTAKGPYGSEWGVYANFTANSTNVYTTGVQTASNKVRIVNYLWWENGTFDSAKQFNCRQPVNVTQNAGSGGNGIVYIRNFHSNMTATYTKPSPECRIYNCSKEIRVAEVFANGSQSLIANMTINNTQYQLYNTGYIDPSTGNYVYNTYCDSTDILLQNSLTANQSKNFMVYFRNPTAEVDYSSPSQGLSAIADSDFSQIRQGGVEYVWQPFFASHVDFQWNNQSDESTTFRQESLDSYGNLTSLGYRPQVQADRPISGFPKSDFVTQIPLDTVYNFDGHGKVNYTSSPCKNGFIIDIPDFDDTVYPDTVRSVQQNLNSIRLAIVASSFSGDNSSTRTGLNDPLYKAFVDKGTQCYIGFQGSATPSDPGACNNTYGDVRIGAMKAWYRCFWSNITIGLPINTSNSEGNRCAVLDVYGPAGGIGLNGSVGGCTQTLK